MIVGGRCVSNGVYWLIIFEILLFMCIVCFYKIILLFGGIWVSIFLIFVLYL